MPLETTSLTHTGMAGGKLLCVLLSRGLLVPSTVANLLLRGENLGWLLEPLWLGRTELQPLAHALWLYGLWWLLAQQQPWSCWGDGGGLLLLLNRRLCQGSWLGSEGLWRPTQRKWLEAGEVVGVQE